MSIRTDLVKHFHWYNNGMNLIETTNHILIEFMFYSTILIPYMTWLLTDELVARKVIRPLEKPTAIIRLNNNYINY